jgi:site-specific recombinase XerD
VLSQVKRMCAAKAIASGPSSWMPRRRNDRLSPWSVWRIVKQLAMDAEPADPQFMGLSRALHTHDTRHYFPRTVLNSGAGPSVVQDLFGTCQSRHHQAHLGHL